jgi:TPR repeat protein
LTIAGGTLSVAATDTPVNKLLLFLAIILTQSVGWSVSPWLAPDLDALKRKAQAGDLESHYLLAKAYGDGMGVQTNYIEAMKWLQPALDKNYDKAQNLYGHMHHYGRGVPKDYAKAREWYLKAANQGNYKAASNIGWMIKEGLGTPKDWKAGDTWHQASFILLQKAAEGGDPDDQSNLAWCNLVGKGIPQRNLKEAYKWYAKAAAQGFPKAEFWVGMFHARGYEMKKDQEEAVRWIRLSAEHGYADAIARLGWWHMDGNGVPKDYGLAKQLLAKAAEMGHRKAQLNLAHLLLKKDYHDQTETDGLKWVQPRAEAGDAEAMQLLGWMSFYGRGVPKSQSESFAWYLKAAEAGRIYAQYWTGQCLHKGKGVKKDMARALEWYRRAAEAGEYHAQLELGQCYEKGTGVAVDLVEAHKWLSLAAEKPEARAKPLLDALQKQLTPEQLKESGERVRRFKEGPGLLPGNPFDKDDEPDDKRVPFRAGDFVQRSRSAAGGDLMAGPCFPT